MHKIYDVLSSCVLFKDFSTDELKEFLNTINFTIEPYLKNTIIKNEGEECTSLGIVHTGKLEIQRLFPTGKSLTVTQLNPSDIFGEALVFSNEHKYPATIISSEKSSVIFIKREEILNACMKNSSFLTGFLSILSSKLIMLNQKITMLSYQSIRQKIAAFLLSHSSNNKNEYIELPVNRNKLSEQLGIPRPSLSREMSNMRDEGLIDFYKNTVKILDFTALEESLI